MKSTLNAQAKAWRERAGALKNVPSTLGLMWNSGRSLVAASVSLRIANALIPFSMLWVSKNIIGAVVAASKHQGGGVSTVIWLLAAEFGLAVLGTFGSRTIDYCDARIADQFSKTVSLRIMQHAEKLDLASFEDPAFYDVLERARVQATDRIGMLNAMGRLLEQAVVLISLSAGVILFSPLLFVALVACVVPAFIGESHFAFLGYSLARDLTPARRELDYIRTLATAKESAKEVKLFWLARHFQERFVKTTDELISRNRRLAGKRLGGGAFLALLGSLGYYGGHAYLVVLAFQGKLKLEDLVFLSGALAGSSSQIQTIFSTFSSIADQALFLGDLVRFFGVKPTIESRPNAIPAPRHIRDGIEFQGVSFHYPGSERLVLNQLDFRMSPGERVALVGENGRGKTTLVKLMCRLYDPTGGRILLDGVDYRDYDLNDLHRQIGVIFQDFMRYDLPARENIGTGQIDRLRQDDLLMDAAAKSQANELLQRFPNGLEQMLGRRFEGGVDLSGGEWQKFALARAYIRDSQIVILDEPTAALDAMAEYQVFRRFSELSEGRMALMISHRFSTVRMCDRIAVISEGVIREQGSHKQLVASGGRYAEMFELQASNYR